MNGKRFRPILEILIISVLAYSVHKLIFYFNQNNPEYANFLYSLETLYLFFSGFSVVIVLVLIHIKSKNIDNVGYSFLFGTCFKMIISYVVLLPILTSKLQNNGVEKINFFIVFALFLAIETIVTIRLLNNKQ